MGRLPCQWLSAISAYIAAYQRVSLNVDVLETQPLPLIVGAGIALSLHSLARSLSRLLDVGDALHPNRLN